MYLFKITQNKFDKTLITSDSSFSFCKAEEHVATGGIFEVFLAFVTLVSTPCCMFAVNHVWHVPNHILLYLCFWLWNPLLDSPETVRCLLLIKRYAIIFVRHPGICDGNIKEISNQNFSFFISAC